MVDSPILNMVYYLNREILPLNYVLSLPHTLQAAVDWAINLGMALASLRDDRGLRSESRRDGHRLQNRSRVQVT